MESDINRPQTPLISRRAAEYIAAIEHAGAGDKVSLDIVAGTGIVEQSRTNFATTDNLWDRHQEIFFGQGALPRLDNIDYDAVITLSDAVILETRRQLGLIQASHLGIAAMQCSAAGAAIARDPSLAKISNPPDDPLLMAQSIKDTSANLAKDLFDQHFSGYLFGDYRSLPDVMVGYLGLLRNTQAAFWASNRFYVDNWGVRSKLPAKAADMVDRLLVKYPPKAFMEDYHSQLGRPDRTVMRSAELIAVEAFNESLHAGGEVRAVDLSENIAAVTSIVYKALQSAAERGVPPHRRLPLIARHAHAVIAATKRTALGLTYLEEELVRFEGPPDGLSLAIVLPELPKHLGNRKLELLKRKTLQAGHCTARHYVELVPNGVTHTNAQTLNAGFEKQFDVPQSALLERDAKVYVHVAHLALEYVLLASAYNNYH